MLRKAAAWSKPTLGEAWREAVAEAGAGSHGPRPLTQYRNDPVGFVVDVLGVKLESIRWASLSHYANHRWDGTVDPLARALEALSRYEWVGVSSGTGTGKTFLMAAAFLWFIAVHDGGIAVTVATKEDQMVKGVWREIGRLFPAFQRHFRTAELTYLRLRMRPGSDAWGGWGITAKPSADATSNTSVQGLHAEYLLILVDEMPGVDQSIITALENTATDPGNVIAGFGNPDNDTDPLAKFSRKTGVDAIRISGLDHPNVVTGRTLVPGAVSRESIAKRATDYGEDSPMFRSRVRGIAPKQAADALIHRVWVDAAIERGRQWVASKALAGYPVAFGVDPSNSDGGDEAAVAKFLGPLCAVVRSAPCPNANDLGAAVLLEAQAEGAAPDCIGVDSIGVGAGTVNEMRRMLGGQASPVPLNSGAKASIRAAKAGEQDGWQADVNLFANLRAQMYWQLREDARQGRIGLPDDPQLIEELIMPVYEVRNGKVLIEPKDDIKRRLGRSPNKADAVVYANWVRPRTKPAPVVPNAKDRHLGLTTDAQTGKKRPVSVKDLAQRPRFGDADGRWWSEWGK